MMVRMLVILNGLRMCIDADCVTFRGHIVSLSCFQMRKTLTFHSKESIRGGQYAGQQLSSIHPDRFLPVLILFFIILPVFNRIKF